MKISIVIPNYNGKKLLEKNLPKVLNSASTDTEVIVVDDCSTDGSVQFLEKYYPKIKLIVLPHNFGFSTAVNAGVNNSTNELVLLLNSDVYPKKESLSFLIPHFKDLKVFAVGCLEKSIENKKVVLRGRGIGHFSKGFLVHQRGEVDKSDTLWVSGGAGIFRKDIWLKLGGMNTLYNPYYWEDIDLSYRAQKAGYKLLFESHSVVLHFHQKGAIQNLYTPFQIKTIAYRNQLQFVWLNITDKSYLIKHFVYLPIHLTKALWRNDRAFLQGFVSAIKMLPQIIASRKLIKKHTKLSDSDLI